MAWVAFNHLFSGCLKSVRVRKTLSGCLKKSRINSFILLIQTIMKASQFFISTLKEAPAEAELASHRLMLRAGLIRRIASGLYAW
ncbi:MAG: hypothetical protein IJV56_00285, partial [Neisseriaceae bacterium]|nr:hypothetical protein [Neisseriaceae bacterium]